MNHAVRESRDTRGCKYSSDFFFRLLSFFTHTAALLSSLQKKNLINLYSNYMLLLFQVSHIRFIADVVVQCEG